MRSVIANFVMTSIVFAAWILAVPESWVALLVVCFHSHFLGFSSGFVYFQNRMNRLEDEMEAEREQQQLIEAIELDRKKRELEKYWREKAHSHGSQNRATINQEPSTKH